MTDIEKSVVAAWKAAAADLGIRFTSPFVMTLSDGREKEHLGLVHQFGATIGTIISVLGEPSELTRPLKGNGYTWSILASSFGRYDRQEFIDTLDDWKFYGPETERPAWYSGRNWT